MANNSSIFGDTKKMALSSKQITGPTLKTDLRFDGLNEEFNKIYYWILHFPYYTGKGYKAVKIEDHHYFSEASQFGMNMRQIKGGSVRAFQENFQQLISLIRQHLLPLLKEIKEAHFYKLWFDKISDNDEIVQSELASGSPDMEKLKKARAERNEAVNHIKDKWVNEVEGGRMWQMNRSATEQGLDFALLPQLFFGINLDDPFQVKRTLKEQLDGDVYPIEVSTTAKEQVARQMYKFHTWLPTAIKDTQVTFKLKVSALKNIYAQVQMYINFMKPLLQEISKKTEGYGAKDFFKDFESESADVLNLFDASYNFVRVIGVKGLERKGHSMSDLEFSRFGLFVKGGGFLNIGAGPFKGKSGFLFGAADGDGEDLKYKFLESSKKEISGEEHKAMMKKWTENPTYVLKKQMTKTPIIENTFQQTRRSQPSKAAQGQMVPHMRNLLEYEAKAWNIYEIASYRANVKEDNLTLMESFVEELAVVKEDLMNYVNYFETYGDETIVSDEVKKKEEEKKKASEGSLITGPFEGLYELISPLLPDLKTKKESSGSDDGQANLDSVNFSAKLDAVEDGWKCYSIFKKANGFIHY